MITFTARLYDATNDEWIDPDYKNYTIAYYNFDAQIDTMDSYLKFTLDTSRLDVDHTNNFLSHMVYSLFRRRYDNLGTEVVRLCISTKTTNYFEIRYIDPQTIYVCETETNVTPIPYLAWFVEYGLNEEPTLQRAPFAWVNKVQTESLNPALATGVYFGSVHCNVDSNNDLGPLTHAILCGDTSFYLKGDTRFYVGDMNSVLGVTNYYGSYRTFVKTYNIPALCVFCINVEGDWVGPCLISYVPDGANMTGNGSPFGPNKSGQIEDAEGVLRTWYWNSGWWAHSTPYTTPFPVFDGSRTRTIREAVEYAINLAKPVVVVTTDKIYLILQGTPLPPEPTPTPDQPNVDPDDIPPADEEPEPTVPDDPDPYYDPESDPGNPEYKPSKDPNNPSYDPTTPDTAYTPPSSTSEKIPEVQPTQDTIATPETPPSYATSNDMFTLYNPSGGDLTNLANFLWSNTWSLDTFKKIFANPMDCILGLMVMPLLGAPVSTKVMNIGNISSGVTLHYFTSQFYDYDCGTFKIEEYYNSYLDYSPYTKVNIFLPFIGDQQLNTDEVMNKTIGVKYRFDIGTGDCVAFITVDGSVLYSFSGNCAARLPISGNNWSGLIPSITGAIAGAGAVAAGVPALGAASALAVTSMKESISHTGALSGSAGLMGVQTPYLIISRPRQVLPMNQNSFTGYPSFITESLSSLSGYTEVEACHLDHVPATGAELEEIERLLKGGVVF